MANLIRFAVVGAGHMGGNHIKKIHNLGPKLGARVSVIVEPDELRAMSWAREFTEKDRPKIISNVGELSKLGAEDYPDAAIIAVPASIHVEAASACIAKGLHCLVEKPLGFSALDCRELETQANAKKVIVQVGLLERWAMGHLWGAWRPKTGPWTVNAVRSGPFVPRAADTDVIHDLMIHDIDLWCMLDSIFSFPKINKVRAWGRKLRSDHLDYAIVALDLEDGGMARFFASRLSAEGARSWEMTGPGWHASIDFMRRSIKRFERVGRDRNAFEPHEFHWTGGDPLALEIEAFCESIRGGHSFKSDSVLAQFCGADKLIPSPQSVIRCHEIMDEVLSCIKILE